MIYIVLNAPAIIAAALAGLGFGALWYRRRIAIDVILITVASGLWLSAILAGALILAPSEAGVWTMTIGSAVVIWAGFVAPALLAAYRLRGLPLSTFLADSGYWLGAMTTQAFVLRLVGLVPPPA